MIVATAPGLLGMLAANIIIAWLVLLVLRNYVKVERRLVGEPKSVATPYLYESPHS